jgi:hypothetical protein
MSPGQAITCGGERTAISVHSSGTDVSRIGFSVRRYYDLPVRPASDDQA